MAKPCLIYKNGNNFARHYKYLSASLAGIIDILDFDSKKLSIIRTKKKIKCIFIMVTIHLF